MYIYKQWYCEWIWVDVHVTYTIYIYVYIYLYMYIYKQCALLPIFTAVQTRCAAAFIPSYPSSLAVICLVGLILEPVWLHARKLRPS